jgi:hypothetical protein
MDVSKKEYITKLRKELDSVESRFIQSIELGLMEAEDMRTAGVQHLVNLKSAQLNSKRLADELKEVQEAIAA